MARPSQVTASVQGRDELRFQRYITELRSRPRIKESLAPLAEP
jgi:hypothetical protein